MLSKSKQAYGVILLFFVLRGISQTNIDSYPLQAGYNKTINLIFPYAIKNVDRGSKDILAQINKGSENVLLVKAGKADFSPTNLSVITADGKLYSFLVRYATDPAPLNISFDADTVRMQPPFFKKSVRDEQIKLTLRSIYISKQVLWFHFDIQNYSQIDFKPGYIKFFIQDKQKAKRTAEQITELIPLFQLTKPILPGKAKQAFSFGFHQFTLPHDKRMVCEISEQNGGRLLVLYVSHNQLLSAHVPLTDNQTVKRN